MVINSKFKILYYFMYVLISVVCFLVFMNYDYEILRIVRYLFLVNMLILLAFIDYKKKVIPNFWLLIMLAMRVLFLMLECIMYKDMINSIVTSSFLGLVAGSTIFLLSSFLIKNSLGMGDVKLMGIVGFYVGISDLFSCMILSLIISLAVGIILIMFKKISKKDFIAFAPFLAVGTILTLLLRL